LVATREHAEDRESILQTTYAWGNRKRQFTHEQIDLAIDRLTSEGWLAADDYSSRTAT
jgi:hypothetical protein